MEIFVIWLSYAYVSGVAFPFIFFPGLPAWKPIGDFIPFLSFIPFSLNTTIWLIAGLMLLAGILNFLARKRKVAVVFIMFAAFFSATANYYREVDITSEHHITKFLDASFFAQTKVKGTIIADPDQRDDFTNIDILPDEIIPDPEREPWNVVKLKGKTGYIRAKIYPSIGDYYHSISYGDRIEITSSINEPRKLSNPAGFNYAAYLKARNIYATTRPLRGTEDITYIGTGEIPVLWRIALGLKKRILLTIRKTMPYPESAFLGGVTLGLRGGVPLKVKSEFQATGVAHVLAVSGLHVGFVAFLLIAFSKIMKLPSKFSFVFVAFGLIIFALITGASPATRRAAIMFSIMEFFRSVMKMRLGHASVLTIPITAMIILIFDPLKLPDGSFVLSFMAVWSLAMITGPVERVFKFIGRGWLFLVFITLVLGSTVLVIINPAIFQDGDFVIKYLIIFALLFTVAIMRERRTPLSGFGIEYLPKWFVAFFYAQFAIQIGMMYPLSAVYFQRFPIAGMYANFIAIPLIGFIVQFGLLAGLIDLVFTSVGLSSVGITLALWINAFNWLCCRLFMGMATFFARLFPYPYMSIPSPFELLVYYLGVLLFVFWTPLRYQARLLFLRLADVFEEGYLRKRFFHIGSAIFVLIAAVISIIYATQKHTSRITFFDVGFGNSVLIETPDRKSILIDAGTGGEWGAGSSVIAPAFSRYNIRKLDYLVLTAIKPSNISGASHILNHWRAGKIYLPYNPDDLTYGTGYHKFLTIYGDWRLLANPRSSQAANLYLAWYELKEIITRDNTKVKKAVSGDIIYERKFGDNVFKVALLQGADAAGAEDNASTVRVSYGKTSVLITTQLGRAAQWELVEKRADALPSDVLLLPKNGNPAALTAELLETVAPKYAVFQYGFVPRARRTDDYFHESEIQRTIQNLDIHDIKPIRTDKQGAAIWTSDGENYTIKTILK